MQGKSSRRIELTALDAIRPREGEPDENAARATQIRAVGSGKKPRQGSQDGVNSGSSEQKSTGRQKPKAYSTIDA